MNLRERSLAVFKARYKLGQNSFRTLAQKTNLSKSSVHRLYHRIIKRNQYPESSLWKTEEGQQWLHLLVLATIFIFALQGEIGCERLSEFFRLLHLAWIIHEESRKDRKKQQFSFKKFSRKKEKRLN